MSEKPLLEQIKLMILLQDEKKHHPYYVQEKFGVDFVPLDRGNQKKVREYLEYWGQDIDRLIEDRNRKLGLNLSHI